MSDDGFDDPGGYFNPGDNVGRLLFFEVVSYREDYPAYDDKEAAEGVKRDGVEVIVTALDGPQAGTLYDQSTLYQGQLVKVLKGRVGGRVLGVLQQGEAKGKYKPPYLIVAASEEQKAVARAHLEATGKAPF